MGISTSISRFTDYFRRHGLRATLRRFGLAVRRGLFSTRMVLFYCELAGDVSSSMVSPNSLKIERKRDCSELSMQDLQTIVHAWNPKLAHRNLKQRFAQGASLWLVKLENRVAGYGWSLRGSTIEPHYFPLGEADAHLFDFHVFPQYRGRGLNPLLVGQILRGLAADCKGRAFIEAAVWNEAQLASLRKTPFRRLGLARKVTLFGRTIVFWAEDEMASRLRETPESMVCGSGRRQHV
jgi:ribosomal protein S18 acetylase RimI-like enzyme